MSYLVDQFKRTYDPYLLGFSSNAHLQLGMAATDGLAFPFTGGGTILQRRPLYPTTGAWSNCGFARPGEILISQMPGYGHAVNTAWHYRAAQVLGNGYASQFSEPIRVDFDALGDLILPLLPNAPSSIVARPIAGGRFRVCFEYNAYGHGAYPNDFQVFAGMTASAIDFNTPLIDSMTGLNLVAASNRARYEFTTAVFVDNIDRVFVVRARNINGIAEQNTIATITKKSRAATVSIGTPMAIGMRMSG